MSDYRIPITPFLDILGEDKDALSYNFVAYEESLFAQVLADEGGFATRCGTEVKDDAVRFHELLQHLLQEHTACLLYIVAARVEERVESERRSLAEVVAVLIPWHFIGVGIEGEAFNFIVETDRCDGLTFQCVEEEIGISGTQLLLHAMYEIYWQHGTSTRLKPRISVQSAAKLRKLWQISAIMYFFIPKQPVKTMKSNRKSPDNHPIITR